MGVGAEEISRRSAIVGSWAETAGGTTGASTTSTTGSAVAAGTVAATDF
jgi:hypothetical protein